MIKSPSLDGLSGPGVSFANYSNEFASMLWVASGATAVVRNIFFVN